MTKSCNKLDRHMDGAEGGYRQTMVRLLDESEVAQETVRLMVVSKYYVARTVRLQRVNDLLVLGVCLKVKEMICWKRFRSGQKFLGKKGLLLDMMGEMMKHNGYSEFDDADKLFMMEF